MRFLPYLPAVLTLAALLTACGGGNSQNGTGADADISPTTSSAPVFHSLERSPAADTPPDVPSPGLGAHGPSATTGSAPELRTHGWYRNAPQPVPSPSPATVTITIDPGTTRPISPYIYGMNFATMTQDAAQGLTFSRAGGNRFTAYNWENNASNAGADWLYQNDSMFGNLNAPPANWVKNYIASERAAGMASLITFPMQGLVAADNDGPTCVMNGSSCASPPPDQPDMSRFKTVIPKKSTQSAVPFTTTPLTTDAYVYMDEFAWALDQHFSGQGIFSAAPTGKPVFASLDNEPEAWAATHREIQGPIGATSDQYIAKTIALAQALKTQFPNMTVFGPAHYGFQGMYDWGGESGFGATADGNNWFVDKYITQVRAASESFGRPLVDVYDFHWYPEAQDGLGNRLTSLNDANLTDAQVQAIVQNPRSLWDPTYIEDSWISLWMVGHWDNNKGGQQPGPIKMLTRMQQKIAAANPGMKIAITEYSTGGGGQIAGTVAQADNLGIFGAQGVFAASLWQTSPTLKYISGGFRAFRAFDGQGSNFGDISVAASSSDTSKVAAYASLDSLRPGRVVVVAINRSTTDQTVAISGLALTGTAHVYRITAASAAAQSTVAPTAVGKQGVSGSSMTLRLPAMSVTTVDVY